MEQISGPAANSHMIPYTTYTNCRLCVHCNMHKAGTPVAQTLVCTPASDPFCSAYTRRLHPTKISSNLLTSCAQSRADQGTHLQRGRRTLRISGAAGRPCKEHTVGKLSLFMVQLAALATKSTTALLGLISSCDFVTGMQFLTQP